MRFFTFDLYIAHRQPYLGRGAALTGLIALPGEKALAIDETEIVQVRSAGGFGGD
jgi:hypothetical protein